MTLMANGKEVSALALGGTEFYSVGKNADGSISFNGENYSFECNYDNNCVSVDAVQSLSASSALTLKDLLNKGKKSD